MQSLALPPRRDPVARITLLALAGLIAYLATVQPSPQAAHADAVIIIPTPALPTAAPTALPMPTAAPVVQAAPPTMDPPAPIVQQIIVERVEQQIVVATPTEPPAPIEVAAPVYIVATAETGVQLPSGAIVIVQPTPGPGDPGFAESFEAPDPQARCAFVGCLP